MRYIEKKLPPQLVRLGYCKIIIQENPAAQKKEKDGIATYFAFGDWHQKGSSKSNSRR